MTLGSASADRNAIPARLRPLRALLGHAAYFFWRVVLFSFFINLLLLISPIYMLQVFDRVLTSRSGETLLMLTLGALLGLLVMAALEIVRSRLFIQASRGLEALLSRTVFNRVVALAPRSGAESGSHLRDVGVLRQFLTGPAMIGLFDLPWMPFFLCVIYFMHPWLAAVALVGVAALVALAVWDEQSTRDRLRVTGLKQAEAARYLDQILRNGEIVNALGMQEAAARRWRERGDAAIDLQSEASARAGQISALTKFLRVLLQVSMLGTGAYLVLQQHMSSGIMMAATILLGKVTSPAEVLIANWRQFIEARAAYGRLDALLAAREGEQDRVSLPAPQGSLSVEKVSFALAPNRPPILKDISFALGQGEALGIIGPSAAGKSSLARVLLGVWPYQSGAVRLDGSEIRHWKKEELGASLGYLPQDVELFSGSVGQNIARLDDAERNSDAVIRAAQLAGAHDMIQRLPDGYDTELGAGGVALSGGQRQRIGLARALYGAPTFVILDEPNANLDIEGERALVAALTTLRAAAVTVVLITHKLSLLTNTDKTLVLNAGQVAAFGPSEEVLRKLTRGIGAGAGVATESVA